MQVVSHLHLLSEACLSQVVQVDCLQQLFWPGKCFPRSLIDPGRMAVSFICIQPSWKRLLIVTQTCTRPLQLLWHNFDASPILSSHARQAAEQVEAAGRGPT